MVTDAGTPGIQDPGVYLVRKALERGINAVVIPGPSAFVLGLVLSGLATDRFVFEGFLPVRKGRKTRLESLANEPRTMIFYEAPHRLGKTLTELLEVLENRKASLARELTKKFEEVRRGMLSELVESTAHASVKGEFVIVVEGLSEYRKRLKKEQDNPSCIR